MGMSILSSEYPDRSEAEMRLQVLIRVRLLPPMAKKHGFDSVEDYKANAQKKFSLLETGIIQKPSTRLLLINVGCPLLLPLLL
jgi:hypothetical protein